MTPLLITLLSRRMKRDLPSCRVTQIGQPDADSVRLSFYHPDRGVVHLVTALLPLHPFLFLSSKRTASAPKPSNFVSSLRKHLEYARLESVSQEAGERIVSLGFTGGDGEPATLVFEALPKYPNLVLVGADGRIVSAFRYKDEVERPVVPGVPYAAPPRPLDRPSLWGLDEKGLRTRWEEAGRPELAPFFKDHLRGSDPEMLRWLVSKGDDAFAEAVRVRERALSGDWGPCRVLTGESVQLRLFPRAEDRPDASDFGDVHLAAAFLYEKERGRRGEHLERRRLEQEIQRALKRENRILVKLKQDRARAERSDQFLWWGELLMAQLHRVPPHVSNVELPDVVRGRDPEVSIPLDPELTAVQNAQVYFGKARKGQRGLAMVEKREREVRDRLHELRSAQRSLPALADVEEVRRAYRSLFPRVKAAPAEPAPGPSRDAERAPTPNLHREKVGKDFELCAGKSAVANEYVTFQLAQPDDLWFHARDAAGAHVVLRRLNRHAKFTDELVLLAALHAARHSKAAKGGKVTVSYTEKKYVRRIPGAPAGMVTMSKERSLVIDLPGPEAP